MKTELQNRVIKKSTIEIRADQDAPADKIIYGVIPYNEPSEKMWLEYNPAADREVITPTAFNKTLADHRNIFLNYNHNSDLILGSTKSGTMTTENKEDGLYWEAVLPDTDIGNRAYQTIRRGDVKTLSFEFYPVEYETRENISYIKSARLEAISVCVSAPAYTTTNCEARSLANQIQTIKTEILKKEFIKMDKEELKELKNLLTAILEKLPKDEEKKEPEKETDATPEKETAAPLQQPKDIRADEEKPEEVAAKDDDSDDETEKLLMELEALKKELEELKA